MKNVRFNIDDPEEIERNPSYSRARPGAVFFLHGSRQQGKLWNDKSCRTSMKQVRFDEKNLEETKCNASYSRARPGAVSSLHGSRQQGKSWDSQSCRTSMKKDLDNNILGDIEWDARYSPACPGAVSFLREPAREFSIDHWNLRVMEPSSELILHLPWRMKESITFAWKECATLGDVLRTIFNHLHKGIDEERVVYRCNSNTYIRVHWEKGRWQIHMSPQRLSSKSEHDLSTFPSSVFHRMQVEWEYNRSSGYTLVPVQHGIPENTLAYAGQTPPFPTIHFSLPWGEYLAGFTCFTDMKVAKVLKKLSEKLRKERFNPKETFILKCDADLLVVTSSLAVSDAH